MVFNGADRLELLIDLIATAKASLRLFFYIFAADGVGHRVLQALLDARARGVEVWLIVDGFGSSDTPEAFFEPLVEAGGVFARFNARFGTRYLLRNHQKMVIADGRSAIIGGANIQSTYFVPDQNAAHWHDILLRIDGAAVERLAAFFDAMRRWVLADKHKIRGFTRILGRRSDRSGPLRWLFNGPFSRLSPLTLSLKRDLEAGQQVEMMEAYFAPNWGMLRRLRRIERRGGRFRLISAALSDNNMTVSAARHCYRGLLKRGAQVFEWQPGPLHAKLVIVDNIVYLGSANFDMRSLFINAENMVRIEDADFADKVRHAFGIHLHHCEGISLATLDQRASPLTKLRWMLSYFIVSTVDFSVTRRFGLRRRTSRK